jgi:hypothetical protein
MIDADRLDQIVRENIEPLCRQLLPQGRKVGHEWKIANTSGEHGDSLGIQLTGPKAGQWHDRATGEGGTFARLLMANRGLSFPDACRRIGDSLGIGLETDFAAKPSRVPLTPEQEPSTMSDFDWTQAVHKFGPPQQQQLGAERDFSSHTLAWLTDRGEIGALLVRGKLCIAFPVPGTNGEVIGAHCRWPEKDAKGKHDWFYTPEGLEIGPLVSGELASAKQTLFFESYWDAYALVNRLDLRDLINTGEIAVVCTRGAQFGDRLAKISLADGCLLFAFPQNDDAGEGWLDSVIAELRRQLRVVRVPDSFKDLNDWTRAGAQKTDLVSAIKAAQIRKPEIRTEEISSNSSGGKRQAEYPKTVLPPEENEEIEEQYDVDWEQTSSISSNASGGDTQEAPFPADSILADYHDYVITQSEGADSYIIGGVLPIIAALLGRNVWVPWANGALYPNLFNLLVGPPGNMKTTSTDPGEAIARGVIELLGDSPHFRFLSHDYSPESLFDSYFKNPWRLLVCDDANATLIKWQNPHDGERLSSNFLRLFDGKRLSETYRRNRKEGDLESQERWTEPTATNIIFGVTFNACEFKGNSQRAGLQRRFLCYVAEERARHLHRPRPDEEWLQGLIKQFSLLSHLKGAFLWAPGTEKLFDEYKDSIDKRISACDILDDRTRGRLTTACAWALKVAMIFEAARLCYVASWMPTDPEIIPDSPELFLHKETLQLAIDHLEACLKGAATLDQVANRKAITEQAQIFLAYIRTRLTAHARNGSIILSRTQITHSYAHNASRRSDWSISDVYDRLIPYLIRIGEAKLLCKEGKKEFYAFRVEASRTHL